MGTKTGIGSQSVPPDIHVRRPWYRPSWPDLFAGISVAAVVIPQSVAYAILAGMPPHRGLYAAAIPPVASAPLASSPYLQPGPTAMASLLTLAALSPLAAAGTTEFVGLAALLALVVGVVRVAVGVLKAGSIAYLMSQPVLLGFTTAAALLIVASQVPELLGVRNPAGDGILQQAASSLTHLASWNAWAVALGILAIGLTVGGKAIHPMFPGVLLAVGVGLAVGVWAHVDLPAAGRIPSGFAPFTLDLPWDRFGDVAVYGVVIAIVGFAEPASIARTYAAQDRERWDAQKEFVSQGAANIAAAFTGGFPVGGSFSRSALNRFVGARSPASSAITGAMVLAFLPVAGVLAPLPRTVLAAIVVASIFSLLRPRDHVEMWRLSKPQFAVSATTFGLTLAFSPRIDRAVLIGVALAIAVHLWREFRVTIEVEGAGELLVLRPKGVLWFGSAGAVSDAFLDHLSRHEETQRLVLDVSGLGRIDVTGMMSILEVARDARSAGLEVTFVGVPPQAERLFTRATRNGEADGSHPVGRADLTPTEGVDLRPQSHQPVDAPATDAT